MENSIAVVADRLFLEHHAGGDGPELGGGHPERPARLAAAEQGLAGSLPGYRRVWLEPRDATDDELGRAHAPEYVERLSRIRGQEGFLDPDTFYAAGSHSAAIRAAGGAVAMVDALLDGRAPFGVALVRPPGHHARPGAAMGFCLLNNVAVAAAHARDRGAARVAIVDWDVHHGNGTQEIFYEDPSVLFISLHQSPFYPGTGAITETGGGDGKGATINVPLSAGAAGAVYSAAFERIVCPALSEFAPDLVLVSAGFDAHARDPLASMKLESSAYGDLTRRLARSLPERGRGRLAFVLEGGYDLEGLRGSVRCTMDALDPAGTLDEAPPSSAPVGARHAAELARAEAAVAAHFHLG